MLSKDVLEFLNKNEPRFKLIRFKKEILDLLNEGCSRRQILKFLLETKNIEVSLSTVNRNISHFIQEENKSTQKIKNSRSESFNKGANFGDKKLSPDEFKKRLKREN